MQSVRIENANDLPSKKKPYYPINAGMRSYLKKNGREVILPVTYEDLSRITFSLRANIAIDV